MKLRNNVFGFNEIPKNVKELDLMTKDAHLQSIREIKSEKPLYTPFGLKKTEENS